MGNQEIKAAMTEVTKADFQKGPSITNTFQTYVYTQINDNDILKTFLNDIGQSELGETEDRYLTEKMQKCFPFHNRISFDQAVSDEDRWDQQARELWQYGYTSWQHNLEQLKINDQNIVLSQNRHTALFEYQFYTKCLFTCANFLLRFQGTTEMKDLISYSQETLEDGDSQFGFKATLQTVFFNLLNSLTGALAGNTDAVLAVVEALLKSTQGVAHGSMYTEEKEGLARDLLMKRVRDFLLSFIESPNSPDNLKAKCIELLLALGLIFGHAENLILAAQFQFQYNIDISKHLVYFFDKSDKFDPPVTDDQGVSTDKWNVTPDHTNRSNHIQNRCSFKNGGDRQEPHHKTITDGSHYYCWADNKGLLKTPKKANGEWESSSDLQVMNTEDSIKQDGWTMFTHGSNLYGRNKDIKDVPFKLIDKSTMKFNEEAPPVTYADAKTKARYSWTDVEDNAPIQSQAESLYRWATVIPAASDGTFIYILVQYYESETVEHAKRKAMYVEKYELSEANVLKYIDEKKLRLEDGSTNFIGRVQKDEDGKFGYLNHGTLVCNGVHLIWLSRRFMHLFNLESGERERKLRVFKADGKPHITSYDKLSNKFYGQDADVYSWLDEFEIAGFLFKVGKDEEDEKKYELPEITFTLNTQKTTINNSLSLLKEPKTQTNILAMVVGGELENKVQGKSKNIYNKAYVEAEKKAKEELKNLDNKEERKANLSEDRWLQDWARAIIVAQVSKNAQKTNHFARSTKKQLDGEKMMKYVREKFAISLSESMFKSIRRILNDILEDYSMQDDNNTSVQLTLKNMLNIYIAHIGCLRPLHFKLKDILSPEEMKEQTDLVEKLRNINLFRGQEANPPPDAVIEEKQLFQLHIYHLAQQIVDEMNVLVSSDSTGEKIRKLEVTFTGLCGQGDIDQAKQKDLEKTLKQYHTAELAILFNQDDDVISKFQSLIKQASMFLSERICKRFDRMLTNKEELSDETFQGFGSTDALRTSEFVFNFNQELMVTFAYQKKLIADNTLPENKEDWTDEQKSRQDQINRKKEIAKEEVESLEKMFFETMIEVGKNVKKNLDEIAPKLIKLKLADDWNNENKTNFFHNIEAMLFGKLSLLRSIMQFTMQIQFIDLSTKWLDEVHLCLQPVIFGLNNLNAAIETLGSQQPELKDQLGSLASPAKHFLRHITFAESKTAARLVHSNNEDVEKSFNKISILKNGIQNRMIPNLSQNCKQEIQGSFKIVEDDELKALAEAPFQPASEKTHVDEFMDKFMSDEVSATQIHKSLFDTIAKLNLQVSDISATERDSDDEDDVNLSDVLTIQAFGIMLHFQDQISILQQAFQTIERDPEEDILQLIEPLHASWVSAKHRVKKWLKSTRQSIEEKVKKEVTDEYFKKLKADNPDGGDAIKKLTDAQQGEVDQKVSFKTATEIDMAIKNASQKLKFLRNCTPIVEKDSVLADDISPDRNSGLWSDDGLATIEPNGSLNRSQAGSAQQEEELKEAEDKDRRRRIIDDVIAVIETDAKFQKLQDYIEHKMIAGLRRLAGFEMFNKILATSSGQVFFDALHLFTASLRNNKSKVSHYMTGVDGCGFKTEKKIQGKFEKAIQLISLRLEIEKDPQQLVNLCDALIWDYKPSDLKILAKYNTVKILSGCIKEMALENYTVTTEEANNPLRAAWGREKSFYSLQNKETSVHNISQQRYSLSARLQQTFDFIAQKTMKIAFTHKDYQLDNQLKTIVNKVLQSINEVIFIKFDQYLDLACRNEIGYAQQRDEFVRITEHTEDHVEKQDDDKTFMVDQYHQALKKKPQDEKERLKECADKKAKLIEKFIVRLVEDSTFGLPSEAMPILSIIYQDEESMREAIIRREWRAYENLKTLKSKVFTDILNLPAEDEPVNEEEKPVNKEEPEKYEEINNLTKTEEQIEKYLVWMRSRSGEEFGITQTVNFSTVTLHRLLKHLTLMMSLAEASTETAKIPFSAMKPTHLETLILLSVYGPASIQANIQKIFQSFLRININQDKLESQVVSAKTRDDKMLKKISLILGIEPIINFDSKFWQLLFNQIQLAKQAQFSPAYQIELGKPVVVQEITRTFLTYSTLKPIANDGGPNWQESIQKKIEQALLKVDTLAEDQVATVFQLVPEAQIPVLATGKRAQAENDQFVILGFKNPSQSRMSSTHLSMIARKGYILQGLILKEGKQYQKSYELRNVTAIEDLGEDILADKDRKKLAKKEATKQNFMKPEVLKKLINVVIQKDVIHRGDPQKANGHRYLQQYVQRGIKMILSYFKEKYMTVLKSFGMLESLITYLSQTTSIQMIESDEPLVSSNLLAVQAQDVQMIAHYTDLSTGFFNQFQIFVDPQNPGSGIVQRSTDERNYTEFMDFPINGTHGSEGVKEKIKDDENNNLNNRINLPNYNEKPECGKCEENLQAQHKISQTLTGFLECQASSKFYCNKCYPKMQTKKFSGLNLGFPSNSLFRISRQEAVLIKSKDLSELSLRTLETLRMTNMVVTDTNPDYPIIDFVKKLDAKIDEDITWMPCASVEVIEVNKNIYDQLSNFIDGKDAQQQNSSRGELLTKVYRAVEYTQGKIEDKENNLPFLINFLKDYTMPYQQFRDERLPQLLQEEIEKDFKDDQATQSSEITKMKDQLNQVKNNSGNIPMADQGAQAKSELIIPKKDSKSPDFMSQLVESSDSKVINECGRDFFSNQASSSNKDYQTQFDALVFKFDDTNPLKTHRNQLNSFINKSNQLGARSIWLFLLSQVAQADPETRDSIKITGKQEKIVDLIHESNMSASHQKLYFGNPKPIETVHKQIEQILVYFDDPDSFEAKKFRDYFNSNLLTRADNTIKNVKETDLQSFSLKELRKVVKLQYLDPSNLIFFATQMYKRQNYVAEQQKAQMAKVMFDLHLGFAILYKMEEDQDISLQLIKGSSWALELIKQNLQAFLINIETVKKFFTAPMLKQLFLFMEQQTEDSDKKRLMSEVLTKLNQIFTNAEKKEQGSLAFERPWKMTVEVNNIIKGYQALLDGKAFTSKVAQIKLYELMDSIKAEHVLQYGRQFKTHKKMFATTFKRVEKAEEDIEIVVSSLKTNKMIGIKNIDSGDALDIDVSSLQKGAKNSIIVAKDQTYEIQFPIAPNNVYMSGRLYCRGSDSDTIELSKFTIQEKVTMNAIAVRARHHHAMFIGSKDDIMGVGYRAGGRDEGKGKHRLLTRPDDCRDYLEYQTGKFFRLVLTKEGKLFFSGQNKRNTVGGQIQLNDCVNEFKDVTNIYPIPKTDKIVSCDGGKHFSIVCTDAGKVYASGSALYRSIDESVRTNAEDNGDFPYELRMVNDAEGYRAEKVWGCDLYDNIWVLGSKEEEGKTTKKTFCLGSDYDMVGGGDSNGARNWRSPKIPDDIWMEQIQSSGMYALGIDNNGDLWEWGGHRQSNEGDEKFFTNPYDTGNSSCYRITWFNDKNRKVVKIRTGKAWGLILAYNPETKFHELYGLGGSDNNRMGEESEVKKIYGDNFKLIQTFSNIQKDIVDFAGSMQACFVITQTKLTLPDSIVKDEPDNRELIHFYKEQNGEWKILKEDQIVDNLPPICFATRHPIKNFDQVRNNLPALSGNPRRDGIFRGIFADEYSGVGRNGEEFGNIMYFSKMIFDGTTRKAYSTEEEVKKGGQQNDMVPQIFYRIKNSMNEVELDQLQALNTADYFEISQPNEETDQVVFSIQKQNLPYQEIYDFPLGGTEVDRAIKQKIKDVKGFDEVMDMELLRAIDLYRAKELDGFDVKLQHTQYDLKKLPFSKCSNILENIEPQILEYRMEFLVDLSLRTSQLLRFTFFEAEQREASISKLLMDARDLLLPSVKKELYNKRLSDFFALKGNAETQSLNLDRVLGDDFWKLGMKENKDFIRDSFFGQYFQQLSMRDSEFTCFQTSDKATENDFSDSDYNAEVGTLNRLAEQELMSDMVPLLVRTPNGQNKLGIKRDCWVLNPRVTQIQNPEWMKCYQLIGSMIAKYSFDKVYNFTVAFAPTFWKLLLNNEPRLIDFAIEDSNLAERLKAMRKGADEQDPAQWPANETWSFVDYNGEVRAVDFEDPQPAGDAQRNAERRVPHSKTDILAKEDYQDFKVKLRASLIKQTQGQMKFVKKGVKNTLGDISYLTKFLNWHDMMVLTEGTSLKQYEKIDFIKEKIKYVDCEETGENKDHIKMFWKIYESLNYEDKKNLFRFWLGRSRIGCDQHKKQTEEFRIRLQHDLPDKEPQSRPEILELVLPESYETEDEFRTKLFSSLSKFFKNNVPYV